MRNPKSPWSRGRMLSFMTSLSYVAGDPLRCEGYLMELLAWCAALGPQSKEL